MAGLKLPRIPRKMMATFSPEQTRKMLDNIDRKTGRGLRDYTMMLVLLDTGVRLSELIGLYIDNISFDQSCFVARGKGGKDRVVPFGSQVRRALWRYLNNARPEPDSPQVKQAFLSDTGLPLRPRAVQSMISRLGKRAGITGVRCSPHTFRHTFAKQYLVNGGDVFSLQKILGHSSLEMVRNYVNLLASDVCQQHHKFSPVDNVVLAGNLRLSNGSSGGYRGRSSVRGTGVMSGGRNRGFITGRGSSGVDGETEQRACLKIRHVVELGQSGGEPDGRYVR